MDGVTVQDDVFSLTRARQTAATLGQPDAALKPGAALPRGWHGAMFALAVPQSSLPPDGFADLGVELPPHDFPRLMAAGRRVRFLGDITIGAPARRESRLLAATPKTGRSGRLMFVTVERRIFCGEPAGGEPVLLEEQDYVLREAAVPGAVPGQGADERAPAERPLFDAAENFVASETMLLRFCALTFNAHRIHYDHPYATGVEGYPALVVNGTLTTLRLTELFRARAGREPSGFAARNIRPLFCGARNRLYAKASPEAWRLWAEDSEGRLALDMQVT